VHECIQAVRIRALSCIGARRILSWSNEVEDVMSTLVPRVFSLISLGTALGSGLVAGIFFAFSNFVMPAINRQPPSSAIATMQAISVVVLNRGFLTLFTGTALGCLLLVVVSALRWEETASKLAIAGALAYLIGTFGVTLRANVPLNESLAAGCEWQVYYGPWMFWNHVRTAAAFVAAALVTIAILIGGVKP
jgi:uncharacterized membrane protein